MKTNKKLLLLSFIMGSLIMLSIPSGMQEVSQGIKNENRIKRLAPTETERQYIGYGYDVTGGKAICDIDALMLNNPILDVESTDLLALMKAFDASQTTYMSNSSASASAISQSYGMALSGGVRGTVPSINLSIGTSFNTNIGWSSTSTKTEEYSYHTIVSKNKTVVLQANTKQLRDHLNARFLTDAKNIKSTNDAKQLIKTYGSHLLTGYTLGGLFELTNYFATDSSSYVREISASFDSQVSATISNMELGTDFSFAMNYGSKDNNSHAVNNYKCTTYGGLAFPGLTIDQAFRYYETAFGAGYIYQIWTDSINDGTSLVICDIPQSSKMIPIWEILPLGGEYDIAKTYLIDAYMTLAADGIANHKSKYPDIVSSISLPEDEIPSFKLKGFEYFSGDDGDVTSKYVATNDSKVPQVMSDFIVALDYDEGPYKGINIDWSIVGEGRATMLDSRSGIFKVGTPDPANPDFNKFRVEAKVGAIKIFGKTFEVIDDSYSAGTGTAEDPFIITSPNQLTHLSKNPEDWDKYFELGADLDMGSSMSELAFIGNKSQAFTGTFDGAYHTISNLKYDYNYLNNCDIDTVANVGLFGKLNGTVKRLNINNGKISFDVSTDNPDSNTPAKEAAIFGFVAGQMMQNAYIEECTVVNSSLLVNQDTLPMTSHSALMYAGGLVGYDDGGSIVDSHIINSSISIRHKDKVPFVCAGGLVGYASYPTSSSGVTMQRVSAVKTSVIAYGGYADSSLAISVAAGGLVGYSPSITLEDALVNNPSSIRSTAYSDNASSVSYSGAVVGYFDNQDASDKATLTRVVTAQVASRLSCFVKVSSKTCGSLFGYCRNVSRVQDTDVYLDNISSLNIFGQNTETDDSIHLITPLSWSSDLGENIKSSDTWKSKSGYPSISYRQVDAGLFEFDFSQAKTEFIIGEHFKTGDIKVTGYDSDGNDFPVTTYNVNFNAFDSQNVGTYQIVVSSFNASASYDVTVKEATRTAIKAELITKTRYIDENVTSQDFHVYSIDDLGHRTEMMDDEYTISSQKTLIKGDNLVTISTIDGKYSSSVVVSAKGRKMNGLSWTEDAPEIKAVYGSRDIDLKGASFIVTYDAGPDMVMRFATHELLKVSYQYDASNVNSYDLDANIVDVIVPSIKYGPDNTGYISYGDYEYKISFDIEGLGAPEQDAIDEFIGKVNAIPTLTNLLEKHQAIREAYHLLDTFGDFRNTEINAAIDELTAQANAYDLAVNNINAEIEEGIIIFSSFNYEILARAGVISYSIVIAIILMIL